jgi:phosphoribosyl-dephospho-CoA transferase
MLSKEFLVTQKTLISFCIQIPLIPIENSEKQENVFKNSRLMMHEIVESSDWINPDTAFNDVENK